MKTRGHVLPDTAVRLPGRFIGLPPRSVWSRWLRASLQVAKLTQQSFATEILEDLREASDADSVKIAERTVRRWLAGAHAPDPDKAYAAGRVLQRHGVVWASGPSALWASGHLRHFVALLGFLSRGPGASSPVVKEFANAALAIPLATWRVSWPETDDTHGEESGFLEGNSGGVLTGPLARQSVAASAVAGWAAPDIDRCWLRVLARIARCKIDPKRGTVDEQRVTSGFDPALLIAYTMARAFGDDYMLCQEAVYPVLQAWSVWHYRDRNFADLVGGTTMHILRDKREEFRHRLEWADYGLADETFGFRHLVTIRHGQARHVSTWFVRRAAGRSDVVRAHRGDGSSRPLRKIRAVRLLKGPYRGTWEIVHHEVAVRSGSRRVKDK
jgi:hypothetical protein